MLTLRCSGPSGKPCCPPCPGLHPTRIPPLRRVGHRPGPQRRGAHHHPVPHRPRTAGRLEGAGNLRRVRPLATDYVTGSLTRLVEKAPGRVWHGYRVYAVDDTKVHRCSKHVWGTCTFHEYTARCPNRATTVRAHNWVVLGAVLHNPDLPAWFLPISGRLYFRKSQLPARSATSRQTEPFRTKCELAVELLREQARLVGGLHLGVFDGGYALKSVVRPLVVPEDGSPRIEFLTRLRHDARLHALPPTERRGAAGADAEVGPHAAAAPPGRALDPVVAGGGRLPLRAEAGLLPVFWSTRNGSSLKGFLTPLTFASDRVRSPRCDHRPR